MNIKNLVLTSILSLSLLITFSFLESFETQPNFKYEVELSKNESNILTPTPMFMYENIEKFSDKYNIPKYIAYNISYLETRYRGPFHWKYNPNQTSCVGALGPMQIMPGTAKMIQKHSVPNNTLKTNISLNVEISMKLLRKLYNKYHNWSIVCGCYNTGKPMINDYVKFCVKNVNYQNNWVKPNNF